jgi:TPP-dependent pyruvate/acetoin dehydrogenase alpha subunit
VLEIDRAASLAVDGCRSRGGPGALIIHTYRLCHHSKNDDNRPIDEVRTRWEDDPLAVHGGRLAIDDRATIDREVDDALADCLRRVREL